MAPCILRCDSCAAHRLLGGTARVASEDQESCVFPFCVGPVSAKHGDSVTAYLNCLVNSLKHIGS